MADRGSELTIAVSKEGNDTAVSLAGELDISTAAQLRACLVDLIGGPQTRLVVDMSRLLFVDSTGLGTLVGALKRVRTEGGEMVLRAPPESIRRKIDIAGLSRVLPIVE